MHVIAGKAVCLGEALTPAFKEYARQIVDNAKTLAEVLRPAACGWSAAGPTTT